MVKFRKRRRLPHESDPLKRFLLGFLIFVLAVAVLGGAWFFAEMGPKDINYDEVGDVLDVSDELLAIKKKSQALEAEFERAMTLGDIGPEEIELIREARDLQQAYLDGLKGVDTESLKRLKDLTVRYENLAAVDLRERSLEIEAEARRLEQKQDYQAARKKYEEAFALQDEINQKFTESDAYNFERATALERQASHLAAEPLFQSSLELEAEADAFIESEDWLQAEAKLEAAIAIQDQLNREFRGSNQAKAARLEALQIKLVGIRSGQENVEIKELVRLADLRKSEGKHLEAARLYQEAARLQGRLNEDFPDSPFASSERIAEYQQQAETQQSVKLGLAVEQKHRRLVDLLSDRRLAEAREVLAALQRDIRQMKEAYPRSTLNDEQLELKTRYLNLIQDDFGAIQERVYKALLPIPEAKEWQILDTEVPQDLFMMLMGTNPSRNRGDRLPVDSVSWIKAKEFCERLSWVMGKSVRLPTENEFRAALGGLRYVVLEDHVWSFSNSEGVTQPVGQKKPFESGCHDLLGNVSEWLESVDRFETEDVRRIGGNVLDRLETIFTVPIHDAPREERDRLTGFRVVVKVG